MNWHSWFTLLVVAGVFVVLAATEYKPYLVLLSALIILMVSGVLPADKALSGFASEGVVTVGVLFVVALALRETGAMAACAHPLLGRPRTVRGAQARMMLPVSAFSAFINNTPLVAMLMPVVKEWARRLRIPPSQLMIPLSYASILGGGCTLIGTSTNLVIHGLLIQSGRPGMRLFDLASVGVPCAVAGLGFLLLFGRRLLPRHGDVVDALSEPKEYTLEMVVGSRSALAGKTIEQAGLRHLPGVFLVEIHRRGGRVIPMVGPQERLEDGDQLIFVGVLDSIVNVHGMPGLDPAAKKLFSLEAQDSHRWFVEAVISHRCPLIGRTIRDAQFRTRYDAAVIGVARGGLRIQKRIGDIVLQAGDTLLLEALPGFVDRYKHSPDFYLVSRFGEADPVRYTHARPALIVFLGMVAVATLGWLSMLEAAFIAAGLMLLTGCITEEKALRRIDWQLLLAIGASFGIGRALELSGAAGIMARQLISYGGTNPHVALALVYFITVLMTEVVTNNAAAVLMFPIAMATSSQLGVDYMPFVIVTAIASSAGFAVPFGYQTHLMVYGAGGYRFMDFVKIGILMDLVVGAVAVAVTPLAWPF